MTSAKDVQGKETTSLKNRHQATIYFEHLGREITLVFSLYSGKEQVCVDNQLVSESRNWHFKSVHVFHAGGVSYALEVVMKKNLRNLVSGIIDIQLRADGSVIDSDQFNSVGYLLGGGHSNAVVTWKRLAFSLLSIFAIGATVGAAVAFFSAKYFS